MTMTTTQSRRKGEKLAQVPMKKLSPQRQANSKVVTAAAGKGGSGKTTTLTNLGNDATKEGLNALVMDTDPSRNGTYRFGVNDGLHKERRLNQYFHLAPEPDRYEEILNLPFIVNYPGVQKRRGAYDVEKIGVLALLPGSQHAETQAGLSSELLFASGRVHGYTSLYSFMEKTIAFWKQYYDLILIDTAPSSETKLLSTLALKLSDEIICPIDGLDAALGIKTLLGWIQATTHGLVKIPNTTFCMVKYQPEVGVADTRINPKAISNNVYKVLKSVFGSYMCDSGVKELRSLRKQYIAFQKTPSRDLSLELITKINTPRDNILKYFTVEKELELNKQLDILMNMYQTKHPVFMQPRYENGI